MCSSFVLWKSVLESVDHAFGNDEANADRLAGRNGLPLTVGHPRSACTAREDRAR